MYEREKTNIKNYLNAMDILPPELLKEIQKYASGTLLYISKDASEGKSWGKLSGQKLYYKKRNQMIFNKFKYGLTVPQLAQEYFKDSFTKIQFSIGN